MLNDENVKIRIEGWQMVWRGRERKEPGKIRKFEVPTINFKCKSYRDLIDLGKCVDTDPPILRDLTFNLDEIEYLACKKIVEHDFAAFIKDLPLHTQPVERCVKLVTEAAKNVCGERSRDGFIVNKLQSRNAMPKFGSKKDFCFGKQFKSLKV